MQFFFLIIYWLISQFFFLATNWWISQFFPSIDWRILQLFLWRTCKLSHAFFSPNNSLVYLTSYPQPINNFHNIFLLLINKFCNFFLFVTYWLKYIYIFFFPNTLTLILHFFGTYLKNFIIFSYNQLINFVFSTLIDEFHNLY